MHGDVRGHCAQTRQPKMLEFRFRREQQLFRLPIRLVQECRTVAVDALREFLSCLQRIFAFGFAPLIAR